MAAEARRAFSSSVPAKRARGPATMKYACAVSMAKALLILGLLLASGLPGGAQAQECRRLSEQLLQQLKADPASSIDIDAEAEQHRRILRTRGCNPQSIGYDLGIEEMKINRELDFKPDKKKPFRLDKLIEIEY